MDILKAIAFLAFWTAIPGLELRASIPVGFFTTTCRETVGGWGNVAAICFVANVLVGVAVFWLMGPVVSLLRRWRWFDLHIWPFFARTQDKLRPYVEKYGEIGLAVFIGIPLPGTGAYTGAFGAYLLGFDKKKFFWANVLGVLIACVIVTAICVLAEQGVVAEDSWVRRLFLKQLEQP
jgi:uncharacterized membrane protein